MENPFKNYLSRAQIARLFGVKTKSTLEWALPQPDFVDEDTNKYLWLKATIEKWKKAVESGKIKKTKAAQ